MLLVRLDLIVSNAILSAHLLSHKERNKIDAEYARLSRLFCSAGETN